MLCIQIVCCGGPVLGLEMTPFLVDVVHALLTMESRLDERPLWVLRVLASTVQRLALVISTKRVEAAGPGTPIGPSPQTEEQLDVQRLPAATAVAAFFSGGMLSWKLPRRRDGFLLNDLGLRLDEDAEDSEEAEQSQGHSKANGRYSQERRVASSVVMWARHFLQSSAAVPRHLAHVSVIHGLTVLSTRVKDLLPHVHSVWQHMEPGSLLNKYVASS